MTEQGPAALAGEARAAGELARLFADPVFYGAGLPRGDGRLVLVIPGLFGNDLYLRPLHGWLRRLGYQSVASTLTFNAGCPEKRSRSVEAALARRMARESRPVAIIGHSRGGIIGTTLAARFQEQISHLALLGSPVGALRRMSVGELPPASQTVVEAGLRVRRLMDPECEFPDCGCPFPTDMRGTLSPETRMHCFYTASDPVVEPSACIIEGAPATEVGGTHSGLVYNPRVYRGLATFLSGR